ncbi:4'-phosphopantetheinyl transferase superfamily protein [Ectothiorhodospira shaposhnikovii]|uniref:4'-phosphopantetheinyl transferase superfamily protein n=1 Tax=Ectothiorhodospira shaposhnikovii TaxID=1054 RepID=UPI001906CABF
MVHALETLGVATPRVLLALLAPWEQARARRFIHDSDRRDYVYAHALRRVLLSECFGGAWQDWDFSRRAGDKPRILNALPGKRPGCSLSHTRGGVAVAVSTDRDIGVDLENQGRSSLDEALIPLVCTASESRELEGLSPAAVPARLLQHWVRKEALSKASGHGLALPFNALGFDRQGWLRKHDKLPSLLLERGARVWSLPAWPGAELALAVLDHGPVVIQMRWEPAEAWLERLCACCRRMGMKWSNCSGHPVKPS